MYSHRASHKQFLRHQLLVRCEKWYILSNYIPKLSQLMGKQNSQKVCLSQRDILHRWVQQHYGQKASEKKL